MSAASVDSGELIVDSGVRTCLERAEDVIAESYKTGCLERLEEFARELARDLDNRGKWQWDEGTEQLFWMADSKTCYHCSKKGKRWALHRNRWGGALFDTFAQLDAFAVKHSAREDLEDES